MQTAANEQDKQSQEAIVPNKRRYSYTDRHCRGSPKTEDNSLPYSEATIEKHMYRCMDG